MEKYPEIESGILVGQMKRIYFDVADVELPDFFSESRISGWLNSIAEIYGKNIGELSYRFCNDSYMLEVNRFYLNHDYYTDILTFDNCMDDVLYGDILISLDTVRSNAEKLNQNFRDEFYRVISHGILHLIGFKDKSPGEEEIMHKAEDRCLELLKSLNY